MYTPRKPALIQRSAQACALIVLGLTLCQSTAWADKPEWAGHGKGKNHMEDRQDQEEGGERGHATIEIGAYFGDDQRRAASEYYDSRARAGRCPPGLAKKHNGCQPPGQAKKWHRGEPLPKDVVFYPVPRDVTVKIGLPPSGYRYVRVANDLLLIAIGTSMVVDAIEDLMR